MKFKRNIVVYLLHTYISPLVHVHGRERFTSSGEMHGDGSLAEAVAPEPKSSNDAMVLALLTPHLTHSVGDGSKNQGPLRLRQQQRHHQQQHQHRSLQDESDWTQVGEDIDGDIAGDYLGQSAAMSADGNRIVVGASGFGARPGYARIFQRVDGSWQQVGNDINAETVGDHFGYSVAMSVDGSRVIVGSPYTEDGSCLPFFCPGRGYVRVFGEPTTGSISSDWIQIGNDINSKAVGDYFGFSVAMSADGSRIAVGAFSNDGNTGNVNDDRGSVQVFGQPTTGLSDWIQIGNDINGEAAGDSFGRSVAMSANGTRIAVGASGHAGSIGQVSVFGEPTTGSDWIQIGNDINGVAAGLFGWSVDMSADGSRIVAGAPFKGSPSVPNGCARIFEQVNDSWEQIGNDIEGKGPEYGFGWSVSMSADGSRVAVGAPFGDNANFFFAGVAQVFDQPTDNGSSWIQIGNDINAKADSEEFGTSVALSANGCCVAAGGIGGNGGEVPALYNGNVRVFEYPSVEATAAPTIAATASPSAAPCPLVHCDFATLQVARFMSNEAQKQRILQDCGIISVTADKNGVPRNVNVFNSSDIKGTLAKFDPDLGSPNRLCPNSGPGIGRGGGPNATFSNCVPQGNLLIIQENNYAENTPNDAWRGGCMYIKFQNEVNLYDMGLLDIEERNMTIMVIDSEANATVVTNPNNIGDNGFWNVHKTEPGFGVEKTVEIKMCLPGSGALSYLDYFACLPR